VSELQEVIARGYIGRLQDSLVGLKDRVEATRDGVPLCEAAAEEFSKAIELIGQAGACLEAARHRTLGVSS